MAVMAINSDTIPPIEEWDLNLTVSNQVYQLLRDGKQPLKAPLWLDDMPSRSMGGFCEWVQENTPPGCYGSISFNKLILP